MENNRFDENLKGKLDGFQPEVDTDIIWKNIEPKLKKKKKNRFIFFWLLFGAGFLFWFLGLKDQYQAPIKITETVENQPITSAKKIKKTKEAIVTSEKASEKPVTSSESAILSPPQRQERNSGWYPQTFESDLVSFSDQLGSDYSNQKVSKNNLRINKTTNSTANPSLPFSKSDSENTNLDANILTNPKVEIASEVKKGSDFNNEITVDVQSDISENKKIKTIELDLNKKINSKSTSKKKSVVKKSKKKKRKKKKRKKKKRKKIFPIKNIAWRPYLQVFGAPEYTFRTLQNRGTIDSELIELRKSTEKLLESYSFGANFQLAHKEGFIMMGGIEYRNITERFRQSETTETAKFENGIISHTVNAVGDTINTQYGMKWKVTTTTTTETEFNYFRFLNLPLGLGYIKNERYGGWKIMGGLNFNLRYSVNALFLDSFGNPRRFDNRPSQLFEKAFKVRANANLWGSFEYFKRINGNIHWMVAPKIEIPTQGLTNVESYPISQRYYNLSLKTGLNILMAKAPKKKKRKRKKKAKSKKARK